MDMIEAKKLFVNVLAPSKAEIKVTMLLKELAIIPFRNETYVDFLSGRVLEEAEDDTHIFDKDPIDTDRMDEMGTPALGKEQNDEANKGAVGENKEADNGSDLRVNVG